jgi:DNA polymerase III epsilon subunit family exonuclease
MDEVSQNYEPAPPSPAENGTDKPFLHLATRAEAFIAEQGGRASEDLLISHVFGSTGSPLLWRPLLRDVLGQNENLRFRTDGSWLLAAEPKRDVASILDEFVVLDVETTGLQASRQRIIEIAIARFDGGEITSLWESLCQPGRRVPEYIVRLTGIDDMLLDDAPRFAELAPTINELLRGAVVVGHNVEFDLAFVNEELKRANYVPVVNERLDTLAMASRLLPGLRKPTLQAVAARLGLEPRTRERHRAAQDATLTGMVAVALLRQAEEAGYRSLDELKPIARQASRRPKERMPRASSVVDRSILKGIPKSPGVYIMRDANERVVYVGKAKNLRDRVGSYFSQPLGYTRKLDGLIESLSRVEVEVVGSELEALLLESQLIRRYQPRYNTALRSHEQYPFIRIDVANPWPRLTLAKARKNDGARYFGPFRSAATARKTVELINRVVPLRTCSRSFRDARSYGSPCLELDLGRCLGPCVGRANRDEYMSLVRSVVNYVDGRDQALHELLWKGLEDAATALDFERASRLRRDLQASLALTAAQRRLREAVESDWLCIVLPSGVVGCRELLLIFAGRLWAQLRIEADEDSAELANRLAASWRRFRACGLREPDHDSVDDMSILGGWLARYDGHPALIPLASTKDEPYWPEIAAKVLAVRRESLDFDAWRKAREVAESAWDEGAASRDDGTTG